MRTNEQPKTIQKKIKLPTTPRLETTITKIPNNRLRMLKCIALFLPGGDLMNKFDMFCYSAFALIWWGCWSVGVGRI